MDKLWLKFNGMKPTCYKNISEFFMLKERNVLVKLKKHPDVRRGKRHPG